MTESIEKHYGTAGIVSRIVQALEEAGLDAQALMRTLCRVLTNFTLEVEKEPNTLRLLLNSASPIIYLMSAAASGGRQDISHNQVAQR